MTAENKTLDKNELLAGQLQKILKAQDTRMELYKEFDIAFKDYLEGKCPAEQYHSICKIVTEGFQDVSNEIQGIERDISDTVIANTIRTLQRIEKDKLEKTAKIQILTIQAKESDKDFDATIQEYKESLKEINEKMYEVWDELREEMHGVSSLVC
ncbi:DNA repair REX1-B-domain-containing protein [Gilbertella persicaria]|uniref:DNA repair REX1-B-domain-containing protein n=1 Tax=Gilbertella persicaria TaxID=101096 RepID=UPI00221E845B|nr:DNA repair REX1-B-domain-containing protein [Gilbertella persicaria]KAI8074286.1 DNA repair REX1-B-domain-containing protein [Gilbertella persicaria]